MKFRSSALVAYMASAPWDFSRNMTGLPKVVLLQMRAKTMAKKSRGR